MKKYLEIAHVIIMGLIVFPILAVAFVMLASVCITANYLKKLFKAMYEDNIHEYDQ